jgi:hypothetical protein
MHALDGLDALDRAVAASAHIHIRRRCDLQHSLLGFARVQPTARAVERSRPQQMLDAQL